MDPSDVSVLVVEDDEFTRMATIDILKSCRYSVVAVENGKLALDLLLNNHGKFDLVLCDMMLPVMNGIELLEELQKHSASLGHIPVVMASSNEGMDVVTSCLSKGAKDYLIKPIQVNTAKTLVRHVWLSRRLEQHATATAKSMWQDIEVLRTIGKGTHGTVVLARRKVDGAVVAVKRVRTAQISENGRKQADNEVILLKSLYHVNIVRFYDHFMVDDELNIVMEYADGGNLRQLVKMRAREKMGPFPEAVIVNWFAQLVLAVAYIHGKNVLHRDLKAQNVFLTRKNVVKLGDFGISKALADDPTANTPCGTPESMSPEICRGEPYGKKSDIWSLGCILYEMIMLKRPFESSTLPEIFTKICKGEYPPILPTFSRELRLLVQLMLQQDSSKRPSIEDICRFPFVQAPIQAFLSQHVSEFQEALELEAKLHQPSLYSNASGASGAAASAAASGASAPASSSSAAAASSAATPVSPASEPSGHTTSSSGSSDSDKASPPVSANHAKQQAHAPAAPSAASNPPEKSKMRSSAAITAAAVGVALDSTPALRHQSTSLDFLNGQDGPESLDDSLADDVRAKVTIADVRVGMFTTYTSCIAGSDVLAALTTHFSKTADEAQRIVADWLTARVMHVVAAENMADPDITRRDTYVRFQVDEMFGALNAKYMCNDTVAQGPMDICLRVREMIAELHTVESFPRGISSGFPKPSLLPGASDAEDYDAPLCRKYRRFLKLVAKLQTIDIATLPKHERQAFFINIYNTMVLHGLIEFGVPQNPGQYKAFEKDVNYLIGTSRQRSCCLSLVCV